MAEKTLAQRIKDKYPGAYDDIPDVDLEQRILARYPGVYDDLPRTRAQPAGIPLGEELTRQSMQEELASRGPVERFMGGVGGRFNEAALALKDLFSRLSPEEQNRLISGAQMQRGTAGALGGMAADVAMTAPMFGAAGAAAPAGALPQMAAGGLAGAVSGGLLSPEDRLAAGLAGGIGGIAGEALGQTLRGLFRPKAQAAKELAARGVRLTPGQAAGGLARLAERAGLAPAAQERAIGDWNKALIQDAVKATGTKISKSGPQGFEQAREAFSKAYNAIDSVPVKRDSIAATQIDKILSASAPDVVATKTLTQVSDRVKQLINRPELTLGALRTKSRDLRSMASKSKDPALGRAFRSMAEALDGMRERSGAASPELDAGYKRFLILEEAAKKGRGDVFSTAHLRNAVRSASETAAFAEGRAPFKQEIKAAEGVFGPSLPVDPGLRQGITGATSLGALSAAGSAVGGVPGAIIAPTLGVALPMAAYTAPGTRFLTGQVPGQRFINPELMGAAGAIGAQGLLGE